MRLAIWTIVILFLLALAGGQDAHSKGLHRPAHQAHRRRCSPPPSHPVAEPVGGPVVQGEIQIPDVKEAFSRAKGNAALASQTFSTAMQSIPNPAPYQTVQRRLLRITMHLIYTVLLDGGTKAPATQPVTFELFRSGQLIYQKKITDAEKFSPLIYETLLDAEFISPIPIHSGQSLEYRFTATFDRQEGLEIPSGEPAINYQPGYIISTGEAPKLAPTGTSSIAYEDAVIHANRAGQR